jgi:hypothetical protein
MQKENSVGVRVPKLHLLFLGDGLRVVQRVAATIAEMLNEYPQQ